MAREFGLSRKTVRKMLAYAVPPGYQRQQPAKRPQLGPCVGVIDAIVEEDKTRPAKQRHTAKRVFDRLRDEHGLQAATRFGFDAVKHLLLCRIERRPPQLDMENYPHLPSAHVRTTQAADYMSLLAGASA